MSREVEGGRSVGYLVTYHVQALVCIASDGIGELDAVTRMLDLGKLIAIRQ